MSTSTNKKTSRTATTSVSTAALAQGEALSHINALALTRASIRPVPYRHGDVSSWSFSSIEESLEGKSFYPGAETGYRGFDNYLKRW
ncbi:unnamed protein product, partial [Amoebophrya sp. A25]|eukprot:GSA25T00022791001.1